jgi:hypothetical protein
MRGHVRAIEGIVKGLADKDAPKEIQDRMKARLKQARQDLQIVIQQQEDNSEAN